MVKVTVIIPVYNQEVLVLKALESIPKRKDIEIVVINDASTDGTWGSLVSYKRLHKDDYGSIVLLSNSENLGVGLTVNRGYDVASGEYVVLLGSDDYFYTNSFIEVLDLLDGTDIVYYDLRINNGDIWKLNLESKLTFCGSTKFIRREFLGDIRCPNKRHSEDYEFYLELLSKDPSEIYTEKVVKHYNFPREGSLIYNAHHEQAGG